MDESDFDDEEPTRAPPSAEELELAQRIFDALELAAPNAFMTGNPRGGRMRVAFDGEFHLLDVARALLTWLQEKKSHSSGV